MAVKIIQGRDVFLFVGSVAVGCAKEASISVSVAAEDASCKATAGWAEFLPGQKSWTASTNGIKRIFTDPDDDTNYSETQFFAALTGATKLTIKFGTTTTGEQYYTGDCYITSFEAAAPENGAATFAVELTGTGALTLATNA